MFWPCVLSVVMLICSVYLQYLCISFNVCLSVFIAVVQDCCLVGAGDGVYYNSRIYNTVISDTGVITQTLTFYTGDDCTGSTSIPASSIYPSCGETYQFFLMNNTDMPATLWTSYFVEK